MIGFVKFNNHDVVGNLKNREFDFINKKNNRPYKTIVFCGQNGSGKTTFLNYFRITKNYETSHKDYYEKFVVNNKWITEENFLRFKYYKSDGYQWYRAYYPNYFNKFCKYPLSTIHDDNEYINDNEWKEFSNLFFCDFSNQKRANQADFKWAPHLFLIKSNYNPSQNQENEQFFRWLENSFRNNTYEVRQLVKITNWALTFLQTNLVILPPWNNFIKEFSSTIGIDKNGNDRYNYQYLIIRKNNHMLEPNKMSTGEWQLIMNIMMLTRKITKFYANNEFVDEHPIIFIDQPEDNLNPKIQIKLFELYQILKRVWKLQFFIVTHSVYLIKNFISDDDSIIYNFDNYEIIDLNELKNKKQPLAVYELNNSKNVSLDEICYLLDQIPTTNYYCNLFECLDYHAKAKYKIKIEDLIKESYLDLKNSYRLNDFNFRNYRNRFIHRIFNKNEKIKIKIGILKKSIDFFREILFNELKKY